MVTDASGIGKTGATEIGSLSSSGTVKAKNSNGLGQQEFLTLLITQLKNQDPEEPEDGGQFAVDLAQFSQVEQLISINDKLDNSNQSTASLAGFLGNQVELDGGRLSVKSGSAGDIKVNLTQDASDLTLQLLNKDGEVVVEKTLGATKSGTKSFSLSDLSVPDGQYDVRVRGNRASGGGEVSATVSISGTVTGFIPGADPQLIVDGRQIPVSAVKEVTLGSGKTI